MATVSCSQRGLCQISTFFNGPTGIRGGYLSRHLEAVRGLRHYSRCSFGKSVAFSGKPSAAHTIAPRMVTQALLNGTTRLDDALCSKGTMLWNGIFSVQARTMSSKQTQKALSESNNNADPESATPTKKPKLLSRLPIPVHENIYTVPNILTFSRLLAAPVIGYAILTSQPVLALSLFAYASVTDLVDGWIARKFNLQTVVGTVIDPMADKTLMTVGVICLAIKSAIPVWLAGIILARDVGLAIAAIYYRWISLPPPKTMARYWDFSLPSAEVKPTTISKANTALQLLLLGSAMSMPVLPEAILTAWHLHDGMSLLQYIVAGTTAWSGLSYVYSKDAVKILTHDEIEKKVAEKKEQK